MMWFKFGTLFPALVFLMALGGATRAGAQPEPEEALDASVFWQEFAADKDGAQDRYAGHPVTVRGVIISGADGLTATNAGVRLSDEINGRSQVICMWPQEQIDRLSDYKPGDRVIMTGRVDRHSEEGILLHECMAHNK